MTDTHVILMTAPAADVAERIVRALVEEELAACGNIVPGVTSIYRWQGSIEHAMEVLVVLKTTAARSEALVARAAELHPYDVPELLALPVAAGFVPYLTWVGAEAGGG
jgi:periplasmic divalent cation tolerance protein